MEGETIQDTERKWVGKEHSLPRRHRGTDKLGHRKEVKERGSLTLWRVQSERQVRTRKGSRGTSYSPSGDVKRGKSGHK
jgi:hypothetical protein